MKDILVVRFSSLGDVVLITGVLKYVKQHHPDVNIDVFTMSQFAGVLEGLDFIRNIYCIDKGVKMATLIDVFNTMPQYDAIFDLHANTRSSLVKLASRATHFTYEKNALARRLFVKYRMCRSRLNKHVVEKYAETFTKALKLPKPTINDLKPFINNPIDKRDGFAKPIVTIHPFASKDGKVWEHFVQLAELLVANDVHVRFIGDGNIEIPNGVENKTGKVPLNKLVQYIADSDVVLSTDSGPLHIATALNVQTLAIFGPTSKELGFYPYFDNCKVIEVNSLKCRPCHIHGPARCKLKHFSCMREITIEEVRHHIQCLLSK